MQTDKLIGALGLAHKAGALIKGNEAVHDAIRQKKAALVLLSADASEGSKKKLITACAYYQVPVREMPLNQDTLARALGASSPCAAAAVKKHEILKLILNNL